MLQKTGRKFGTRLKEQKTQTQAVTNKRFTRNQRVSEQNKSALTDHAAHDNHVINWLAATILNGESNNQSMDQRGSTHLERGTTILELG